MRYANILFKAKERSSIGDQMQILLADYIFSRMGIPQNEIIYIEKDELPTYSGEPVVLPVCFPLFEYQQDGVAGWFSKSIKPVFLGHTIAKESLSAAEADYYKRFSPIGCRDEHILDVMKSYGIDAYLNGCMTAAFPLRTAAQTPRDKVFVVDAPDWAVNAMPDSLKTRAQLLSHHLDKAGDIKEIARERYELYKREGSLIVTSLLHCAVPCMAAGIPVVIAKSFYSFRFAWLEKLIHTYLPDEAPEINWLPEMINYEPHKKALLDLAISRIKGNDDAGKISAVNDFYMDRARREYIIDAFYSVKQFIDSHWLEKERAYRYSLWGLTQMSEIAVRYIKNNYPNAKLMHVYDQYRCVEFEGMNSQQPKNIEKYPDEYVFVTTGNASKAAVELFDSLGRSADSYAVTQVVI